MTKTDADFKNQVLTNLNEEFNILVTGTMAADKAKKVGLEPIKGLDNIFTGALKGKEILKLEKSHGIESIELDKSQKILEK